MSAVRKKDTRPLYHATDKFREIVLKLLLALAGTSVTICSMVGGVIHLYAVFLAFHVSGIVAALLTFLAPFFAELYWIATIWSETGVFWQGLTIACVAYFILCAMAIIANLVAASTVD